MRRMSKSILGYILFFFIQVYSFAQNSPDIPKKSTFSADYMMGTYLLLDDVDYKSVILNGFRLGIKPGNRVAYQLEYLIGSQEDRTGITGTTHTANIHILYYLDDRSGKFSPYLYGGGGFFEFKDFSRDKLGVALNAGVGTEVNFSDKIAALAEFRYINLGPLNLQGTHQIGVLWGIRLNI